MIYIYILIKVIVKPLGQIQRAHLLQIIQFPKQDTRKAMAKKTLYKVSHILDRKEQYNPKEKTYTVYYKVAWEGYDEEQATWEPASNLVSKQLKKQMQQFDSLYGKKPIKKVNQAKVVNKMSLESQNVKSDDDSEQKKVDNSLSSISAVGKRNVRSKYQKNNQNENVEPENNLRNLSTTFEKNQKKRLEKFKKTFLVKKDTPKQKEVFFETLNSKINSFLAKNKNVQKQSVIQLDLSKSKNQQNIIPQDKQKETIKIESSFEEFEEKKDDLTIAKPDNTNTIQQNSDDDNLLKQGISSKLKIKGMLKLKDSFLYLVQQNGKSKVMKRKDMLICYPYQLICFYETRINIEPAEIDSFVERSLDSPKTQESKKQK